jgi:hypothetical protein
MELMIDLACHAQGCFRSEDPLEAARFVVSQAVSALWETVLDAQGFAEFTARAVPQLVRWERGVRVERGPGCRQGQGAGTAAGGRLAPILETPDNVAWLRRRLPRRAVPDRGRRGAAAEQEEQEDPPGLGRFISGPGLYEEKADRQSRPLELPVA